MLDHHDGIGDGDGRLAGLGAADEISAVVVKDDAGTATFGAVASRRDDRGGAFGDEELERLFTELGDSSALGEGVLDIGHTGVYRGIRIGLELGEFLVGVPLEEGLGEVGRRAHGANENDLACELALVLSRSAASWKSM